MKIETVEIKNYRLLKDVEIDLEDNLSVAIGKNNTGKTSFMSILQKFLESEKPKFKFEDFDFDTQEEIIKLLEDNLVSPDDYQEKAISLKLIIGYDANKDNISQLADYILDLDMDNNHVVILFEYVLTFEKYKVMHEKCAKYTEALTEESSETDRKSAIEKFVNKNIGEYWTCRVRALEYNNEENIKDLKLEQIRQTIAMKSISAKRDVNNEQGKSRTLSALAEKYYNTHSPTGVDFPELEKQLSSTDKQLSEQYKDIFENVVEEISRMSYGEKEAKLEFISNLGAKNLLQDNTVVKYSHNGTLLPEDYNGLGYLNLINIIFSIRLSLDGLAKANSNFGNPAPLNILFIEEPEAHTHPQMQYIFIHNIKSMLEGFCKENEGLHLQTIISTHSSHIVSQCDFNDIRYFVRPNDKTTSVKNLKDFQLGPDNEDAMRFVKQYITPNCAELFFADKAIVAEGDTERILMPEMMRKIDMEKQSAGSDWSPLLSQNISTWQIGGAYAHIFADFMGFLGIKFLILTDLDCCKRETDGKGSRPKKCKFSDNAVVTTSNATIKAFTTKDDIKEIVKLPDDEKIYKYCDNGKWEVEQDGNLKLAFQTQADGYQPRSFEDAFICQNEGYFMDHLDEFTSITNKKRICEEELDPYDIAEHIENKADFALDLILLDNEDNPWVIPDYIREGLEWLEK